MVVSWRGERVSGQVGTEGRERERKKVDLSKHSTASQSHITGFCCHAFLDQKFEHLYSMQVIRDPLAQPSGVILGETTIQHCFQPTWSRKWNRKWSKGNRKSIGMKQEVVGEEQEDSMEECKINGNFEGISERAARK